MHFMPLTNQVEAEYLRRYAAQEPHADYCLYNVKAWLNHKNDLEVAFVGDNTVLRYTDPFGSSGKVYSCFGSTRISDLIQKIFKQQILDGEEPKVMMVPGSTVNKLRSRSILKVLDLDNSDYVYDARSLAMLTGPKSKGFNRQIYHFLKNHSEHVNLKHLSLANKIHRDQILRALDSWPNAYSHNDSYMIEDGIIRNMLTADNHTHDAEAILLYIEGKPHGLAIYSYPPQDDHVILHHIKGSRIFTSILDFMVFCCVARAIAERNVHWLNFEQDLGIEGLREHKLRLKPLRYLGKYTLAPAPVATLIPADRISL